MPTEQEILEEKIWVFEEFFIRDLESWFSSDIACCDECYDNFLSQWPLAYSADKAVFQTNSISLDCFYSGSILQVYYTKEQFEYFIQFINCPRCGSSLKYNMWPYTLQFDVIDDFENKMKAIATISQNTPFLLLKNPFAQEVYQTISDISANIELKFLENTLYRGRTDIKNSISLKKFDFPPSEVVSEGRYNHACIPVL